MKQQKRQSSAEVPVPGDFKFRNGVRTEAVKGRIATNKPTQDKGFYGLGGSYIEAGLLNKDVIKQPARSNQNNPQRKW